MQLKCMFTAPIALPVLLLIHFIDDLCLPVKRRNTKVLAEMFVKDVFYWLQFCPLLES